MKLQLTESCFTCQGIPNKDKNYQTFLQNYQKLNTQELENTLCVSISQIKEYIPRCVSCLGCRTRFFFSIFFLLINLGFDLVLIILLKQLFNIDIELWNRLF